MSPTEYSPIRVLIEPRLPIGTPPMAVMMSLSRRPALSAGLPLIMAEYFFSVKI